MTLTKALIVSGGCTHGLFERGMTIQSLLDAVHAQRNHAAFLHGGTLDHVARRTLDDEVTHRLVRHQELVETATSSIILPVIIKLSP